MDASLNEKLRIPHLVMKFLAFFFWTSRFIATFTRAHHLSLSWARSIQPMPPHSTFWRTILVLPSHIHLGLPTGLVPSRFPTKTLYASGAAPVLSVLMPVFLRGDNLWIVCDRDSIRPKWKCSRNLVYILKNSYFFLRKLKYPVITTEMNENVRFLFHSAVHMWSESQQMPVCVK